jgi:hypothetical protein
MLRLRTATVAAALTLAIGSAAHAELFASSASSAGSASSASLSNSVQASSNSSNPANKPTAGDYRIENIAAAADRPDTLRLALAHDDGRSFFLLLPQATVDQQRLARGETLRVSEQPYGLAFARVEAQGPFFLALADDWLRELAPRRVPAL